MALVRDRQFDVGGVTFGAGCPVQIEDGGFKPGQGDWRTQDAEHALGDGGMPGRDFQGIGTWAFELFTDVRSEDAALAAAQELRSVWPADELRSSPLAVTALRYRLAGRVRRIYGRPRRWTPSPSRLTIRGRLLITADFSVMDPLHYDDVEWSVTSDLTGSTNPLGISSPVRSPVAATFGLWTAPTRTAVVGGDRPTWPVLEFHGGVNPWCEIAGWRCRVLASLNWDQTVVVDTRPWVRSSTLNGSYMSLDRGSRLQEMRVPPGRWPVRYGNDSSAGAPSVTVRGRNAWSSL